MIWLTKSERHWISPRSSEALGLDLVVLPPGLERAMRLLVGDVSWGYALCIQDLAAKYNLGRHALRVEGRRRY
jgi:hypothetical protein